MPGCSNINSINRILKIFTKLITHADGKSESKADGGAEGGAESGVVKPYSKLLSSLNKLATIPETELCEWLQRIIMAAPGQVEVNDSESQGDRNAFLLHTLAGYMVRESRSVSYSQSVSQSQLVNHS